MAGGYLMNQISELAGEVKVQRLEYVRHLNILLLGTLGSYQHTLIKLKETCSCVYRRAALPVQAHTPSSKIDNNDKSKNTC